jgi:protein TonB
MDLDYTVFLKPLMARAREANPLAMDLAGSGDSLPPRGQRPPRLLRVGGDSAQQTLVQQQRPIYPDAAKHRGIMGTVRLSVLIGTSGAVEKIFPISGPRELRQCSVEAVEKWRYKPTSLNGRPARIVTTVDVTYQLGVP